MSVFRINRNKNYTVISKYHLKDKTLSLKAKGLLSMMLSLSEDWKYSIAGLIAICKENETAIKSSLSELKEKGYLKITKYFPNNTETGRIEYVYDIYEIPIQDIQKQEVENLPLENQGQYNTNNRILNNKKDISNKLDISKKEEIFQKFWNAYPKKKNKGDVEKWFKKNNPSEELVDLMIEKINVLKNTEQWKKEKGQYIPYPSSWLNKKGWEDEIEDDAEDRGRELKSDGSGGFWLC